jgi:hypothetical protein
MYSLAKEFWIIWLLKKNKCSAESAEMSTRRLRNQE